MNLAIDIGNTRTKLAVFDGDKLVHKEIWDNLTLLPVKKLTYNQKVRKVILSSVAEVPQEMEEFLSSHFFYLRLTTETALPIFVRYQTPETLGKDRIAAVTGAFHLFPGENCLVIDAGTCITYDVLSAEGVFLGGNIAPGVEMRLKAMHHLTARLPLVSLPSEMSRRNDNEGSFLGFSTESAMRNGGLLGAVLEMDGFIELCSAKFQPLKVILTGGDADFFAKTMKSKIFARPDLVLVGLNKILNYNVEIKRGY